MREYQELREILSRIQPKLIAFNLPPDDIREIMTRPALTKITVLREIEAFGLDEVAVSLRIK